MHMLSGSCLQITNINYHAIAWNYLYMLYTFFIKPYLPRNTLASSTIFTFLTIACNGGSNSHTNLIYSKSNSCQPKTAMKMLINTEHFSTIHPWTQIKSKSWSINGTKVLVKKRGKLKNNNKYTKPEWYTC